MTKSRSVVTAMTGFDTQRAVLNEADMFEPFVVQSTEPLLDALLDKKVGASTPLLLLERDGAVLTLLTRQMIYYHVAQGELNGVPFLATY